MFIDNKGVVGCCRPGDICKGKCRLCCPDIHVGAAFECPFYVPNAALSREGVAFNVPHATVQRCISSPESRAWQLGLLALVFFDSPSYKVDQQQTRYSVAEIGCERATFW